MRDSKGQIASLARHVSTRENVDKTLRQHWQTTLLKIVILKSQHIFSFGTEKWKTKIKHESLLNYFTLTRAIQ